jgi:hypothetical protein
MARGVQQLGDTMPAGWNIRVTTFDSEAVAEVTGNEFVGPGMRPGDVRRHSKKADPEDE